MGNLSPYVLFRRGTLPFQDLDGMVPKGAWDLLDELDACELERRTLAQRISDELYEFVPTIDDRNERAQVIRLRRKVHNAEVASESAIDLVEPLLPPQTVAHLRDWRRVDERFDQLNRATHTLYKSELDYARLHLRAVVMQPAFRKGLQLSGKQLYRDAIRYSSEAGDGARWNNRKIVESTLASYAYRIALKPSPFGAFAEVGAFPLSSDFRRQPYTLSDQRGRSSVTLNRLVLNWIEDSFSALDGGEYITRVFLNSSIIRTSSGLAFIGNSDTASQGSMPGHRVVVIREDSALTEVKRRLSAGPALLGEVLDELSAVLLCSRDEAEAIVGGLVRIGFLFLGSGIPDQEENYSDHLAALLKGAQSQDLASVREAIADLQLLEGRFGAVSFDERDALLERGERAIRTVADTAKISEPPSEFLRSLVYEDVPAASAPGSWDHAAIESATSAFEAIIRLASLLDPGPVRRMALYSFFRQKFGSENRRVPLLSLFRHYATTSSTAIRESYLAESPELDNRLMEGRREILGTIAAMDDGGSTIRMSGSVLNNQLRRLTEGLPLVSSAALRLQINSGSDSESTELILNGISTGYGAFFSRFSGFLPDHAGGWGLKGAVRDHLREQWPDQTDLTAVLGLNFNLHPLLVSNELVYPGSIPASTGVTAMSPSELDVVPDDDRHELKLVRRDTGNTVHLVPMNFLIPIGVPPLYQLLQGLSPTSHYSLNLWSDILDQSGLPERRKTPRLTIDQLVVERTTWRYDCPELPHMAGLSKHELDSLIAFEKWRVDEGLPRFMFFLVQSSRDARILAGKEALPEGDYELLSHLRRASVHKPHFLDTHNPFLMRIFARAVLNSPDASVTLRECLPSVENYRADAKLTAAEEFFIEYNLA